MIEVIKAQIQFVKRMTIEKLISSELNSLENL